MSEGLVLRQPEEGTAPQGSLVLPTLNEAQALPHTLLNIARVLSHQPGGLRSWEVLIADGGSSDNTRKVHTLLSSRLGLRTRWLSPPQPPEELSASLLGALKVASTRYCIIMDADGSHPTTLIPLISKTLANGAAIVVASRYIKGGSSSSMGTGRHILSTACARLSKPLLGLSDPLTGCAGLDLDQVVLPRSPPRGFKLIAELVRQNRDSSIVEIPLVFQPRWKGRSKLDLGTCYHFARQWLSWALSGNRAGDLT